MPYSDIRLSRLYSKQRRERAIAAGLCIYCHRDKPDPGRRRCATCQAKVKETQRTYMQRQRQAAKHFHLCLHCLRQEAMPGQSCCGYCQEWQSEYHHRVRKHRRKEKNRDQT